MTATSTARARWTGTLLEGSGTVSTTSPALDEVAMTWKARTGGQAGTTPEELLGAAHASCFSMALSARLAKDGHPAERLDVEASVSFGPVDGGNAVLGIELTLEAVVPGMDEQAFLEHAQEAKVGCPISVALGGGVPVELDARLLQHA